MPSGGYRRPNDPAPVSGAGRLSQRTDGGPADRQPMRNLPDAKYGEQKDFQQIEGGAPMAKAQQAPQPQLVGLNEASAHPDVPVTAGADAGAGPGSDALGIPDLTQADLTSILPYLPALEFMANRPNASPATRAFVRRIKSML